MFTNDSAVGVNDETEPETVTLNVLLLMAIVQFPADTPKTCPLVNPKLQAFKLLELNVVSESAVRSNVVLPSIKLTFQFNCREGFGKRTLVVRVKDGGCTTELA